MKSSRLPCLTARTNKVNCSGWTPAIVAACVADARTFGLERVFALTYKPGFFEKQGFRVAIVMEFPQKVWNECVRCPFFTNCKEVAVVLDLALLVVSAASRLDGDPDEKEAAVPPSVR